MGTDTIGNAWMMSLCNGKEPRHGEGKNSTCSSVSGLDFRGADPHPTDCHRFYASYSSMLAGTQVKPTAEV